MYNNNNNNNNNNNGDVLCVYVWCIVYLVYVILALDINYIVSHCFDINYVIPVLYIIGIWYILYTILYSYIIILYLHLKYIFKYRAEEGTNKSIESFSNKPFSMKS